MLYRISFSKAARVDMLTIQEYLQEQVNQGLAPDDLPNLTLNFITNKIQELELFPNRFPIIDHKLNMRRMVIDKYRYSVFYRVENQTIKIYHIHHQAQKLNFNK